MTEKELKEALRDVPGADEAARAAAHAHWARLAKPLGGLGALETMVEDTAALTGRETPDVSRRAALVLCADNGVVAQGVSQTDQSVTRAVAANLAAGRTSVCRMAAAARCDVVPVDIGMAGEKVEGVLYRRIADGTADFTQGPAMTREQALLAIETGMALVRDAREAGFSLLATGEMGIGNTTTSSAVAAVLLGEPVERMTGRGAGLSDAGLGRKLDAIRRGISRNCPNAEDALDVLGKLGGLDIAGLCGVFLGGARYRVPIVMDGFISGVAALCAVRLCPRAEAAIFASHASSEPAARRVMEALGKRPLITAGMHLGEGTGAVASIPLCAVYAAMLTLVIGGSASGKSAFAERLAVQSGLPRFYVATMRVWDAESERRVARHRDMRREKRFDTLECPIGLDRLILPARGTVLLEDMGNLVANELYDADGAGRDAAETAVRGVERLHRQYAHLIVVSNEVFRGGADYAGDTARYLLALARANNAVAARADHVCRVVCGLPRWVKGGDEFGRT